MSLSSEETQTHLVAHCTVGLQTLSTKKCAIRSTHTQTWEPPDRVSSNASHHNHLASQIKKVFLSVLIDNFTILYVIITILYVGSNYLFNNDCNKSRKGDNSIVSSLYIRPCSIFCYRGLETMPGTFQIQRLCRLLTMY